MEHSATAESVIGKNGKEGKISKRKDFREDNDAGSFFC
jgi:hypothetical protein